MEPSGHQRGRTQTGDLARVLRDYALDSRRRELRAGAAQVVVIEDALGARRLSGGEEYDAVWLQLECLEGIDVEDIARGVARSLRPGGRLVCVVPGAWPLGLLLQRALLGRGEEPGARGVAFSAWRQAFEPAIAWRRSRALGLLVVSGAGASPLQPLSLGLLASAEALVAGWPLLRTLGEWIVHEGVRR